VQCTRQPDGSIGFNGVLSCGSLWACPCCAVRIYTARADEVKHACESWLAASADNVLSMLTLTVRHAAGFELRKMRKGMSAAWRSLWQGRAGQARKRRWALAHFVRSLEVTHGANGWHPHYHVALFQTREHTEGDVDELREAWAAAVAKHLGAHYAPSWERGIDVRPLSQADYLTKLGLEVASITTKEPRQPGSRSAWQIAQAAARGEVDAVALWREYTEAMRGARQLFWSHGARRALDIGPERTDAELAPDGWGYVIAEWDAREWDTEARDRFWLSRVQAAAALGDEQIKKLPGVASRAPPPAVWHVHERVHRVRELDASSVAFLRSLGGLEATDFRSALPRAAT